MTSAEPTEADYRQYRLEAQLLHAARLRLQALGALVTHVHGERFQERCVDIVGCYKSRFFAIELKVGRNKPTPAQMLYLQQVQAAGGVTAVAYTVADCLAVIQEIERSLSP